MRSFGVSLREQARLLGAGAVGVAPAELPPLGQGGPSVYRDWVSRGRHGLMGYMARDPERRMGIRSWFPEARSVIMCAFSYGGGRQAGPKPGEGRLSRYCLPPDYHDTLREKMERLRDWYTDNVPEKEGRTQHPRIFVDTSPVLERLYGRLAGLGWIGKNAMLISREMGSYFFLAGMAVDRDLEHDAPVPDRCGTCERCLEACPTKAFPSPRVLDATRCVAYSTIEQRSAPIPEDLRRSHGDWVFGCDTCQERCPWNKKSRRTAALTPRLDPTADLEELAALSPDDFDGRFRGTPLHRTGRAALLRNTLLAMGNSGSPRHRATLERYSADRDPLLSEQARWSLRELGGKASEH
ncbi:tRNA epoxyqueuosine(34) reductase QueG [Elusimicrobiota bacterium]